MIIAVLRCVDVFYAHVIFLLKSQRREKMIEYMSLCVGLMIRTLSFVLLWSYEYFLPSLDDVYLDVTQEKDSRLPAITHESCVDGVSFTAQLTNHSHNFNFNNEKPRSGTIICKICGRTGHVAKQCFFHYRLSDLVGRQTEKSWLCGFNIGLRCFGFPK